MVTTVLKHENSEVHTSEDIIRVRQTARIWSVELGLTWLIRQNLSLPPASWRVTCSISAAEAR